MERQHEVMRQCLDLLETIQEGLVHVQHQINAGRFESTIPLFNDVVHAYEQVELAIIGACRFEWNQTNLTV